MTESNVGYLSHTGFIVPTSILKARLKHGFKPFLRKLTVTHYPRVGPSKTIKLYKEIVCNGTACIRLPRTLVDVLSKAQVVAVRVLFLPIRTIPAELTLTLFDNQIAIVNYICAQFTPARIASGTATCLLDLRAGMGKTFVAAGLIARLKLRTLYVVTTRTLAYQCVKDLRLCFYGDDGPRPVGISDASGDAGPRPLSNDDSNAQARRIVIGRTDHIIKKDKTSLPANQDITVIVINTALKQTAEFIAGYSLIILDEVHSLCSATRSEIFSKCSHLCLGMTATPKDRQDGFDVIAHKELAFGGIVHAESIPGFTYENVEFDCQARVIHYIGPPDHTERLTHPATGCLFVSYMYAQFLGDPHRLRLVVSELLALYDWVGPEGQQHSIYVFAEELAHLRTAKDAFMVELARRQRQDVIIALEPALADARQESVVPANTDNPDAVRPAGVQAGIKSMQPEANIADMFVGGTSDEKIASITKNTRVLFSTFGYAGTGVSILKMTAEIYLTPRYAAMKQIVARILRRGSDLTIPRIVVDIVDKKTTMRYQLGARRLARESYGFKETDLIVKYADIPM